jgi:predicted O-methyltransferase YrrM
MSWSNAMENVLRAIEKEAHTGKRFLPIVGTKKGKLLFLIAKAIGAKQVLDLGTLVGYSALLLSQAVGKRGKVITVEKESSMVHEAKANFKKAKATNIQLVESDVKSAIRELRGPFDLIFLDVWKEEYTALLPFCIRTLRKGGVLIADNALWDTRGMQKFRNALMKNTQMESVFIPIQDGMSLSVKK